MWYTSLRRSYWILRRFLLKVLVPEYLWPREVMIAETPIKVRNTPYSFGTKLSLVKKNYELEEIKLLEGVLMPDDNVVEMGGSIGVLTRVISNKLTKGRIVSIEASEKLTNYSKTLLEKNLNTVVISGYGFPVWKLRFNLKINNFDEDGGSLGGKVQYSLTGKNRSSLAINDKIFDLERIVSEEGVNPSVLVIDIEGSEKIILDNPACLPNKIRIILIELHPNIYGVDTAMLIVSKIKSEGFEVTKNLNNVYLFSRFN